jgi:hypothetical protein
MKEAKISRFKTSNSLMCLCLIVAFSSLLGACSGGEESRVIKEVKAMLNDPNSAEFRNIKVFENGNYCGEVNAKNKMGGYVGFQAFFMVESKLEIMKGIDPEYLCYQARDPVGAKCFSLMRDMDNFKKSVAAKKQKIEEIDPKGTWGGMYLEMLIRELTESETWLKNKTEERAKLSCN